MGKRKSLNVFSVIVTLIACAATSLNLLWFSDQKLLFVGYESAYEYTFNGTQISNDLDYAPSNFYYPDGQGGYYSLGSVYLDKPRPLLSSELRTIISKYDARGNLQWQKRLPQRSEGPFRRTASVNQRGEFQLTLASSITDLVSAVNHCNDRPITCTNRVNYYSSQK